MSSNAAPRLFDVSKDSEKLCSALLDELERLSKLITDADNPPLASTVSYIDRAVAIYLQIRAILVDEMQRLATPSETATCEDIHRDAMQRARKHYPQWNNNQSTLNDSNTPTPESPNE